MLGRPGFVLCIKNDPIAPPSLELLAVLPVDQKKKKNNFSQYFFFINGKDGHFRMVFFKVKPCWIIWINEHDDEINSFIRLFEIRKSPFVLFYRGI